MAPAAPTDPAWKTSAAPLVEARGVSKVYPPARRVLDGVTFAVPRLDSVAIVGASGSGKTTLLNLLSGLDRPTAGAVLFDGRTPPDAAAWTRLRSRRIGIVFQNFCLLPTLTAAENVEVPMLGVEASQARRRERSHALLARVGLADLADSLPAALSAGERQRVAIARSLANAPALLLADEPTGNLDRDNADRIMELLAGLLASDGLTLIVVTHDATVAARCRRRLVLAGGRIAEAADQPKPTVSAETVGR